MAEECANLKSERKHFWILLENHHSDEFQEGKGPNFLLCKSSERKQISGSKSTVHHTAQPGWRRCRTPSQTPHWPCHGAKGAPSSLALDSSTAWALPTGKDSTRNELKAPLSLCWCSPGRSGKALLELPKLCVACKEQPSPASTHLLLLTSTLSPTTKNTTCAQIFLSWLLTL